MGAFECEDIQLKSKHYKYIVDKQANTEKKLFQDVFNFKNYKNQISTSFYRYQTHCYFFFGVRACDTF